MSLKLSGQLDNAGDPNLAFKLYESYIDYNKWRIPESALRIIAHPDWSGGSQSEAPYYSHLVSTELDGVGTRGARLKLTLLKDEYVPTPVNILINYHGLLELDIPSSDRLSESKLIWRYEQFLYSDAYHRYQIKDKLFNHQIEWVGGYVWSITARHIEVEWKEALKS